MPASAKRSPEPLLASVLDTIGEEIVSGVQAEGDTFTLHDLSKRFDISRTVAREAMRALEQLGLVSSSRRVGLKVLPQSEWHVFDNAVISWRLRSEEQRAAQIESLRELRDAIEPSAARLAARGGVPVLLTATANIDAALSDARVGTVFHTRPERKLNAWKFWALYAADAEGVLRLDAGAVDAVTRGGTSLLAVGITGIEGEFHAGDIVEILGPDSEAIGRGEVAYDAAELTTMLGKHSGELAEHQRRPVVHADYLSNYASRL